MSRWTAIAVIMSLILAGNVAYYGYEYLSSRHAEVSGPICVLPAVYRSRPQQEIAILVNRVELSFTTKSAAPDLLPAASDAVQMLVAAEFMSCQYEKRNPGLTEEQKYCYRAFILSTLQPLQRTIYENCIQRNVFSRHLGELRSLAVLLARSPSSKIVLDLDDRAKGFLTDEIQASDDEQLVRRICEINKEKISCIPDVGTMRIRVK